MINTDRMTKKTELANIKNGQLFFCPELNTLHFKMNREQCRAVNLDTGENLTVKFSEAFDETHTFLMYA